MGGRPFPDGWEPDDDRGGADEDFASVVFDEAFIKSATFHEPSAVERLLAAAEARAAAEAARLRSGGPPDDEFYDEFYGPGGGCDREDGYGYDPDDPDGYAGPYGPHGGALRPYRGNARWHRPVAWLLALLLGIGMVALAFSAVYRGRRAAARNRHPRFYHDRGGHDPFGRAGHRSRDRAGGGVSQDRDQDRTAPATGAVPHTP